MSLWLEVEGLRCIIITKKVIHLFPTWPFRYDLIFQINEFLAITYFLNLLRFSFWVKPIRSTRCSAVILLAVELKMTSILLVESGMQTFWINFLFMNFRHNFVLGLSFFQSDRRLLTIDIGDQNFILSHLNVGTFLTLSFSTSNHSHIYVDSCNCGTSVHIWVHF